MIGARNVRGLRPHCRRTAIEVLESRTLLSGDVAAVQTGTALVISGDEQCNQIMLWSPALNTVTVQGENDTTVNGTCDPQTYCGVEQIAVEMNAGDDSVKAYYLDIDAAATSFASLSIDGGAGDDYLAVSGSTISSPDTVQVSLTGEQLVATQVSSGNDVIEVCDTTLHAGGGANATVLLQIAGEVNNGGVVTCGNDRISVTNTCVAAENTDPAGSSFADVEISGETGPENATGVGNDSISVCGTRVSATGSVFSDRAVLRVLGDNNAAGSLSGGNDCISVSQSSVFASGATTALADASASNQATMEVYGESNAAGTSVGGGNDNISVSDVCVTTSGVTIDNEATLNVYGDGSGAGGQIAGGNDSILIQRARIASSGSVGNDIANLTVLGDDNFSSDPTGVGQGDDCITVDCVTLVGTTTPSPLRTVRLDAGKGCDFVKFLNSSFGNGLFQMGTGDDTLWFTGNTFITATADGGPGYDKLVANSNTGVLTAIGFEQINGMPNLLPMVILT